jgi:hypothetical protein
MKRTQSILLDPQWASPRVCRVSYDEYTMDEYTMTNRVVETKYSKLIPICSYIAVQKKLRANSRTSRKNILLNKFYE